MLSGRQFLQWRCSYQFNVIVKRDGNAVTLLESLLQFDPTPDTSWRTLRAEVDIPIHINWEDKLCVEVASDGDMPVYDVRGLVLGYKELAIRFVAFGNAENNSPRLMHIYKDEGWNRERETLAGLGLDKSVMAGLGGL